MPMTSETSQLVFATIEGVGTLAMGAHSATPSSDRSALICDRKPNRRSTTVDFIYLKENGYVVVHRSDAQSKPAGVSIGNVGLETGGHRNIDVALNEQPKSGEKLWVSLYRISDARRSFATGERRAPFLSAEWSP